MFDLGGKIMNTLIQNSHTVSKKKGMISRPSLVYCDSGKFNYPKIVGKPYKIFFSFGENDLKVTSPKLLL